MGRNMAGNYFVPYDANSLTTAFDSLVAVFSSRRSAWERDEPRCRALFPEPLLLSSSSRAVRPAEGLTRVDFRLRSTVVLDVGLLKSRIL